MKSLLKKALISIKCILVFVFAPVFADEIEKNKQELKQIRKEIGTLKQTILENEKTLDSEYHTLIKLEKEIVFLIEAKLKFEHQISLSKNRQNQLKKQISEERIRIKDQTSNLEELILNQYKVEQNNYLKLILSQKDPSEIERSTFYYKYIASDIFKQIQDKRKQINNYLSLQSEMKKEQDELANLLTNLRDEQDKLNSAQLSKKQLIGKLDNKLALSTNKVERLQQDEKRVKILLDGLMKLKHQRLIKQKQQNAKNQYLTENANKNSKRNASQQPSSAKRLNKANLSNLRGKLKKPVSGKITAYFGSNRKGSGLRYNGLLFSVKQGAQVQSLYNGQVVYADWFKGFGQLVIVDHGFNYMSLYSHNSKIVSTVGDWVNKGQLIAYSGASGGLTKPGLYFEVRHNNNPKDPLLWIKP